MNPMCSLNNKLNMGKRKLLKILGMEKKDDRKDDDEENG